ncbi:hypothetical protein [Bradyrhizobium sp.]|uniref:hypothetical protein n=1 Tax=Bradyrhizobium sp. TaxID=376 RepID=UPI0039E4FC3D
MDEKFRRETARRIMREGAELRHLAAHAELDTLTHLLSMVILEASSMADTRDGAG